MSETTVRTRLFPLCRCGSGMFEHSRVQKHGRLLDRWCCRNRRWYNFWRHPFSYTFP